VQQESAIGPGFMSSHDRQSASSDEFSSKPRRAFKGPRCRMIHTIDNKQALCHGFREKYEVHYLIQAIFI
jgi:hypothetical protein